MYLKRQEFGLNLLHHMAALGASCRGIIALGIFAYRVSEIDLDHMFDGIGPARTGIGLFLDLAEVQPLLEQSLANTNGS